MSVYDTSPEAHARYRQKQAEVATWTYQAPTHYSVSTPGWQTPGLQPGVLSPGLSSPALVPGNTNLRNAVARSTTSDDSTTRGPSSQSHSQVPSPGPVLYHQTSPSVHSHRDVYATQNHSSVPPTPLGIYYPPPSSVGSVGDDVPRIHVEPPSSSGSISSRRTKSNRHDAERSRTLTDYGTPASPQLISHSPSRTYSLSPLPRGASTRRSGSNKSSSLSFAPQVYPLHSAPTSFSPSPAGFVPYPPPPGSSRSSSSSVVHLVDQTHTPRRDEYSERFVPQSPLSVSSTQSQYHEYPVASSQPPPRAVTAIAYPYTGYAPSVTSSASSHTEVYERPREYTGVRQGRHRYASSDDEDSVTAVNTVKNGGSASGIQLQDKFKVVQGELSVRLSFPSLLETTVANLYYGISRKTCSKSSTTPPTSHLQTVNALNKASIPRRIPAALQDTFRWILGRLLTSMDSSWRIRLG